ncbi:MAG TPA: phosphoribosylamine--glycine ligase [Chloroflexota bacterium]|nr:phosphoribosylamine--glycine ligase [Chloroflexota bacterium]
MRVLIVGGGAREHTLAWCAVRSPRVSEVLVAPGNPGTARLRGPAGVTASNVQVDPLDPTALVETARRERIELAIVGSEDPLAAGAVDALAGAGIRAFGPTRAAARIETSKVWSKAFMARHGIPTAPFEVFDAPEDAHAFVDRRPWGDRLVVKADGLARGKGVIVCDGTAEAHQAITALMEQGIFGPAGARVVIEQRLDGREASVFALCDGTTALPMGAAQDHKRIFDGDRGPNTGGMGAFTPTPLVPPAVLHEVMERIVRPAVAGLAAEGYPFTGFLYAGLIFSAGSPQGPQVIEFNARFGDPEAQAVLPLLESDVIALVEAALDRRLAQTEIRWREGAGCAVCLASAGYPDAVRDGVPISGLDQLDEDALVFHAGTAERDGQLITSGGRALTIVGRGPTLAEARARAYANVARVHFDGVQYRTDIAAPPPGSGGEAAASPSPAQRAAGLGGEGGTR